MLFLFLELAVYYYYYEGPPLMPLLPRGTLNFLGAAWYCYYYCLSLVDLYEDLLIIQD